MQNEFFAGERIAPENIEKKSEDIFTNSLNFSGLISDIIDNRLYSAESGYYYIDLSYKIPVKQIWSFKYNAKASAKSTMSNVTLRVSYIYDMTYGWNFR